jgi:hypothetical protein
MRPLILSLVVLFAWSFPVIAKDRQTTLAEKGITARVDQLLEFTQAGAPDNFELGMMQVLLAFEKALRTTAEYGLLNAIPGTPLFTNRRGEPIEATKTATPGTYAIMLRTFNQDMQTARAYLNDGDFLAFNLNLADVWFDLNGDGIRDNSESAWMLFRPLMQRDPGRFSRMGDLTVRFDEADKAWLLAYTHLLEGISHAYLAFDPTPVLARMAAARASMATLPTIPDYYDSDSLISQRDQLREDLKDAQAKSDQAKERVDVMRKERREVDKSLRSSKLDDAEKQLLEARKATLGAALETVQPKYDTLRQEVRGLHRELAILDQKLGGVRNSWLDNPETRRAIDAAYVVLASLSQTPDLVHIQAVEDNWREMIVQNRIFWDLVVAETDKRDEWIPNQSQTSAIGIQIPPGSQEAWQSILSDAEAVLDGKLLVPHPLLPDGVGINLRTYFDAPGALDPVDWLLGPGASPYLARGQLITDQNWLAFQRLTGGNALGFALFFN